MSVNLQHLPPPLVIKVYIDHSKHTGAAGDFHSERAGGGSEKIKLKKAGQAGRQAGRPPMRKRKSGTMPKEPKIFHAKEEIVI